METPTKRPVEEIPPAHDGAGPPVWQRTSFKVLLVLVAIAVVLGLLIKNQYPQWMAHWNKATAKQKLAKKEYDAALSDVNQALQWLPENPELYELRGQINAAKGGDEGLKAALLDYNKLMKLNPYYFPGFRGRADVQQRLGNYKKYVEDMDAYASWLSEDDPERYNARSYARAVAGDKLGEKEWKKEMEQALKDINHALKLIGKGDESQEEELPADEEQPAGEALKKQMSQNKQHSALLDTRAFVYYRLGEQEKALQDADEAVKLSEKVQKYLLEQAKDATDEEKEHIEKAYNESLAVMHQHRGLIYEKMGEKEKSQADLKKAKELGYDPKAGVY